MGRHADGRINVDASLRVRLQTEERGKRWGVSLNDHFVGVVQRMDGRSDDRAFDGGALVDRALQPIRFWPTRHAAAASVVGLYLAEEQRRHLTRTGEAS